MAFQWRQNLFVWEEKSFETSSKPSLEVDRLTVEGATPQSTIVVQEVFIWFETSFRTMVLETIRSFGGLWT